MSLELIPINKDNYQLMRLWRNDNKEFFANPIYINKTIHDAWYRKIKEDKTSFQYIIYHSNIPIGGIGIDDYVPNKSATIARVIMGDVRFRRKGLMRRAIEMLMKLYGDISYSIEVVSDNKPAINLYLKCGFVKTGTNINKHGINTVKMKKL